MELNLNFYKGKDEYSDGDIEDKIIELIKEYPDDYEKAFKEDSSWPVFYHLSDMRKNSIRWYPFKKDASILEIGGGMGAITEELCNKCSKVTTVELSKKRATAILERNKNRKNLEIIVGNYKDIKLTKKYDYILLNGMLEYSTLYMNSANPYEDFVNELKKNLKKDGIILIAIENKFGLKYWCGANEDHTGIQFDGLNDYHDSKMVRTFSKNELENLARNCNMSINFYYMFPDYKFPTVIYTDKSLSKNIFVKYDPYYYNEANLILSERQLYKDIYNNSVIPFFANSYFIELSNNKREIMIDFVKFNSFRRLEYRLFTYSINNKYYKCAYSKKSSKFLNDYKASSNQLEKIGFKTINVLEDEQGVYTDECSEESFLDIISKSSDDKENILENLNIYRNYLYSHYNTTIDVNTKPTVFEKYNILIDKTKRDKLTFIDKAYIDIIPQNMILSNDEYYLIDQEWMMDNVPLEFILYRGILSVVINLGDKFQKDCFLEFLKEFNILDYLKEFEMLEEAFQKSILGSSYDAFKIYVGNAKNGIVVSTEHEDKLQSEKQLLISEKTALISEVEDLKHQLNDIYNSQRWKLMNKILKIFGK